MTTVFDPQHKLITSAVFSPYSLASLRLLAAIYTTFTAIFTLVWEIVITHDGRRYAVGQPFPILCEIWTRSYQILLIFYRFVLHWTVRLFLGCGSTNRLPCEEEWEILPIAKVAKGFAVPAYPVVLLNRYIP
jgi:hypothetical protein